MLMFTKAENADSPMTIAVAPPNPNHLPSPSQGGYVAAHRLGAVATELVDSGSSTETLRQTLPFNLLPDRPFEPENLGDYLVTLDKWSEKRSRALDPSKVVATRERVKETIGYDLGSILAVGYLPRYEFDTLGDDSQATSEIRGKLTRFYIVDISETNRGKHAAESEPGPRVMLVGANHLAQIRAYALGLVGEESLPEPGVDMPIIGPNASQCIGRDASGWLPVRKDPHPSASSVTRGGIPGLYKSVSRQQAKLSVSPEGVITLEQIGTNPMSLLLGGPGGVPAPTSLTDRVPTDPWGEGPDSVDPSDLELAALVKNKIVPLPRYSDHDDF